MELLSFLSLKDEEIATLMRANGPKVCGCPINGTRRWYFLEAHPLQQQVGRENGYLKVVLGKYIELFHLFFSHGIDTILTPIFGPDLLSRGDDYLGVAIQGMRDLVTNPQFLEFVKAHQVRVRFYGDYVRYFKGTLFEFLIDLFDQLVTETAHFTRHRLYWGVVGHDATEQIAEIGAKFYSQTNRYPSRQEIVEAYYGEYVDPMSLFIGFDKFSAFDMPILTTGAEDLYFTTCPTPYMTKKQLRLILYDHLFSRKGEPEYEDLKVEDWDRMRHFYEMNKENTLGVGIKVAGVWYPLPQVNGIEKVTTPYRGNDANVAINSSN